MPAQIELLRLVLPDVLKDHIAHLNLMIIAYIDNGLGVS